MPPAIPIIAGLAADALGAVGGSALAGGLGLAGDTGILGLTGADIASGLGGGLASGLTTGLMTGNPVEGLISGVGGALGGPSIASGVGSLASDVGLNLGLPGAANAATGSVTGAAGNAATAPSVAATTTPATSVPAGAFSLSQPLPGLSGSAGGAGAIAPPAGSIAPSGDATATGVLSSLGGVPGLPPSQLNLTAGLPTVAPPVTAAASTPVAPAAATAGGTGTTPTSFDQFIKDPTWSSAFNVLKSNPQAVVGGLGLGYDVMHQGNVPGLGALQSAATSAQKNSSELMSYINTGQLPPGYQAAMDQAKQAAKAQLRSKYAGLGMSGSTAEAQDIANVDVQAVAAQADVAANLLQSGISEANVSQQLLADIVGINQQQDTETTNAIMSFAQALGGSQPLYLNLGH